MKHRYVCLFAALSLILMPFFTKAQEPDPGKQMDQKEIKMLIDSISFSLKKYYIYPDKADLIEKALRTNYKNGAYKNFINRKEVANTLNADIQKVHNDRHMHLMYAPNFEKELMTVLPDSLLKKAMELELNDERKQNFSFVKTEIMPGNIGYVRWDGFVGFTKEAKPTYESAFQFVCNTEALIIDLRYNGGGSPETVNAMLNYFFNKRIPLNHHISYMKDTLKFYSDPSVTSFKLNMPVYILTQRRTFSGAEDFTYAMKVAKRATLVGDTTGGGAHPTGPCTLGQGFVLNIPDARSWHEITKTNWEGTGVYPDIYTKGELALDKTLQLIFKERLEKANEDEKKMAEWQYAIFENKLKLAELSTTGQVIYTKEELQKFCGDLKALPVAGASPYPLSIIMKGESLYRSTGIPPDFKIIAISKTRFVYENDSDYNRYMEFSFDKEGKVSGLTIYRHDGIFPYERVK